MLTLPTLWCSSSAPFLSLSCRRQLERANAEEEQIAAEALQQVQAERQRDQDTNFQLLLQAEEIKVTAPAFVAVAACQSLTAPMWQQAKAQAPDSCMKWVRYLSSEERVEKINKDFSMTCAPAPCTIHVMSAFKLNRVDCASAESCVSGA